jgi:putative acetyltransferase
MRVLDTDRMILRPWTMEDLDDFYEYTRNPNIGPNAGWPPHDSKETSMKILQSFIDKGEVWAIEYKADKKVIGSLGAHNDAKRDGVKARMIGYVLSEDYWGKGLMSEAVHTVIKYLFEEEKYDIITCYHYPFNCRSKRVIEKCGFKYEGTLRLASKIYDGSVYDDVCYSIVKEDYFNR